MKTVSRVIPRVLLLPLARTFISLKCVKSKNYIVETPPRVILVTRVSNLNVQGYSHNNNNNNNVQGYSPDVAFRWFLGETVSPLPGAQKVRKVKSENGP